MRWKYWTRKAWYGLVIAVGIGLGIGLGNEFYPAHGTFLSILLGYWVAAGFIVTAVMPQAWEFLIAKLYD